MLKRRHFSAFITLHRFENLGVKRMEIVLLLVHFQGFFDVAQGRRVLAIFMGDLGLLEPVLHTGWLKIRRNSALDLGSFRRWGTCGGWSFHGSRDTIPEPSVGFGQVFVARGCLEFLRADESVGVRLLSEPEKGGFDFIR